MVTIIASASRRAALSIAAPGTPTGPGQGACRRSRSARAGIGKDAMHDEPVPDEEHDERADRGADEARTLVEPIPADRLADEGRDEGADDPQHRRQDEAPRLVGPWRQET